jgi:predicted AlkP superfamily pyrophosphatase or phosphodiesterase
MARSLTIFIDGIPFDQLHKMPYTREFKSRARLVPILGYSVNCQTQLFTGKTPDELGFWCEWQYDPSNSPFRKLRWLLLLAAPLDRWYPAKRVIHKLLDRLGWVSGTKNIPLRVLADFSETGHSVFNPRFEQTSLLDAPGLHKFLHSSFPVVARRDEDAFRAALEHIRRADDPGHVLVTFTRIDHCSHWEGVASGPYDAMLAKNDDYIRELREAFLASVPDGTVLVVSDLRAYLDGIEGIEGFGEDERRHDGITRPEFGDLIYHALEGYQFIPSFWGPKPSAGMHGHHPRFPSQHGVCLSSREGDFEGEVRAGDFYRVLAEHLSA